MFILAFAAEGAIQLLPDGTMFIHIALILLMIWTLNRTFFRPINKVIESREKNKGGRSSEAVGILSDVEKKNALYEKEMLEARSQAYELIEKERAEAVTQRQTRIETVKTEVFRKVAKENAVLEKQTAEAKTLIATEAEKMSDQIRENFLKAV